MNRRLLLFIMLVFAASESGAQISISLQEPPPGIVQKQQLWNIALVYNGTDPLDVQITLSLVDIRDNQPVLTASTRPITLTKGVKQLRQNNLSPIEYNYFSAAFNRLPGSFLPVGSYRACYSVYDRLKNAEALLAEACIAIEVWPLSPPQLITPADTATMQNTQPQFSWLAPAPLVMFAQLNYDLLLVEVREDQTPYSAIQENIPIYYNNRLTTVFNSYPSSAKNLDTGKVYAWRVIAKDREMFAAQSEVWTFRIQPDKPEQVIPAGGQYLELQNDQTVTGTAIIPTNVLGIKYYSYEQLHDADIKIFNERRELVKTFRKPVIYGNNFWVFKLENLVKKEVVYFVEITDLKQGRYHTSFSISK